MTHKEVKRTTIRLQPKFAAYIRTECFARRCTITELVEEGLELLQKKSAADATLEASTKRILRARAQRPRPKRTRKLRRTTTATPKRRSLK